MKTLRKLILLFSSSALALCGCSSQKSVVNGTSEKLPQLKIGIDSNYEPFSYIDESGNYAGLDIELAKEACSRMNREPVFYSIKWDYKDSYLEDGSIDCVWSCFSMNGREDDYTWVGPYMYSRQVVAVRSDSSIKTFSDLAGKVVAVMSSTKPESIFLENKDSRLPSVKNVYSMENMNLVFSALQLGYADAAAGHETVVRQYIDTTPGEYRLLDESLLSASIGIAFGKDRNNDISNELSRVLTEMENDGTLGNILEEYGVSAKSADGGEIQ